MELIRPFERIGKGDAAIAGGKGASLGEMTQAGIPVPPGFVVLVNAFEQFLKETDLNIQISAILDTVDTEAIHTVEGASEKIQALILAAAMPEDLKTLIVADFQKLGAEFVAVRSSATAEDGAAAAWAGQLDTYLNTTDATLLENVQRCWASLFTPRAIFYRFEKGLHSTHISVAVVIQKMVNSDAAGIAFSVHPVTEDYNQLIIEAGFGLGEAVVSGQVTPDSYVITKVPREIMDKNISEQTRAIYRKEGGGNEWRNIPTEKASLQVLTDEQILALTETVIGIEKHYGFPVDTEWAMEKGEMYITQSRPITTLTNNNQASELHFNSPALQGFNPTDYEYDGLWKNDLFPTCFWQDCWVPDVVTDIKLDMQGAGVMNLKGGHFLINKAARANVDAQIKQIIDERNGAFFKNLVSVSDNIFSWAVEKGEEIKTKPPTLDAFRDFVATAKKVNFLWLIGASYIQWPVEERLQEAIIEDKIPAEHALDVVPKVDTPLIRYQEGLTSLAKEVEGKSFAEIKNDPTLYEKLETHAKAYSWIEIFNFIGEPLTPERLYEQLAHIDTTKSLHAYVPSSPLSSKLQFVAECMQAVGYVKQAGAEYFSIFSEKTIPFLQKVAGEIGLTYRELMCLLVDEVDQALEGKITTEELKKRANKRLETVDWVVIGGADGKMIFADDPADINLLVEKMVPRIGAGTQELVGQIGNRGSFTGPARIIMNTYDFNKLQPGDVLVTTMTTPDFIVLMQKSGAIVTDIGGLLCHAAIVSRELGKPCVIGTKFATQLFKDGDMVEVDGDKGVVRKI